MAISDSLPDITGCIIHGRYQLAEMLGCGSFGVVYKAIDLDVADDSENIVALKIICLADRSDSELALIEREVIMHTAASGIEGVVTLLDTFDDARWCCLVLEYCSGGDLFDQSITKQTYIGNDELLRKAFLSLVDAVEACHNLGIAHRDLKPENIFTNEDGSRCYLGDFSLATNQPMVCDFGVGTRRYMSPECIGRMSRQAYDPYLSDIWALGIILFAMVTGANPWQRATYQDAAYCQFLEDPDFLFNAYPISAGVQDIIQSLLGHHPEGRMNLPFLRQAILSLDTFFRPASQIDSYVVPEHEHVREYTAMIRLEIAPSPAGAAESESESEYAYMAPDIDIPCVGPEPHVRAAWDCSDGSAVVASDYSFSNTIPPLSSSYYPSSRSSSRTSSEVSDGEPMFNMMLEGPITITAHMLWDEIMFVDGHQNQKEVGGVYGW